VFRQLLRSKIHRAVITDACLEYEGSLTVDEDLLDAAGIVPCEVVMVSNLHHGKRFTTCAMKTARAAPVPGYETAPRNAKGLLGIGSLFSVPTIRRKTKSSVIVRRCFRWTNATGFSRVPPELRLPSRHCCHGNARGSGQSQSPWNITPANPAGSGTAAEALSLSQPFQKCGTG